MGKRIRYITTAPTYDQYPGSRLRYLSGIGKVTMLRDEGEPTHFPNCRQPYVDFMPGHGDRLATCGCKESLDAVAK